ncbi:hypothetical protein ElyMa_005731900 [Elysia marginata]|uniref:Uncharacterized protein n=1 Tax=Elysia marginata TaxID=1093978 RepID=A0AAV4FMC1_9GAST|nr:hypothetical protein ElyMa_005731900 [Elysia marginata]
MSQRILSTLSEAENPYLHQQQQQQQQQQRHSCECQYHTPLKDVHTFPFKCRRHRLAVRHLQTQPWNSRKLAGADNRNIEFQFARSDLPLADGCPRVSSDDPMLSNTRILLPKLKQQQRDIDRAAVGVQLFVPAQLQQTFTPSVSSAHSLSIPPLYLPYRLRITCNV